MDAQSREKFWNTLCALDGVDVKQDAQKLSDVIQYKQFLGYEKGPDDIPVVVEEEAKIVRRIFALFMEGKTPYLIAKALTADGIPTPAGKSKWGTTTVASILTNGSVKIGLNQKALNSKRAPV